MIYYLTCLIIFVLPSYMHALEYGIFAVCENSKPITKVWVIGERCSGTNYLTALLLRNFEVKENGLGHKHFPPWYVLPQEHYKGNQQYYTFEGTEDFLFVVIFRNPYDWVRSFHKKPWHADHSLTHASFKDFIRLPWKIKVGDWREEQQISWNERVDADPFTGNLFANVFGLRKAKIETMLQIADRAPNVYYINYEIVRDYPQEVLQEIATHFAVVAKPEYTPIDTYKGKRSSYHPKNYDPFSEEDLAFINSQLDEILENRIGYQIIRDYTHTPPSEAPVPPK